MSRTETRPCPICQSVFTWDSRWPNRRYCSPLCKAESCREVKNDRRRRKRRAAQRATHRNIMTPEVPTAPAAADQGDHADHEDRVDHADQTGRGNQEDRVDHEDRADHDEPQLLCLAMRASSQSSTTGQRCPHCHEPIAVINLLVPPAAAYVDTPSQSVTNMI
ncbi:hypothetical protein ABZ897_62250 [Nonomuraea sp. NPDC046802]|uniref:hypothetical protein n=1 Tax=Nonomuraea sp. NPDC046802 TaxID=3154919 RepID=UPI0033D71833